MTLDNASIAENLPAGIKVGVFTTTDPDAGDSHSYALVAGIGDDDNASFAIVGDELQSAAVFDFESQASFSIRVQTSDGEGGTLEQAFAIAVTKEPPTAIALDNASIAENEPAGTKVGVFTTTSPDPGGSYSYALVAGIGDDDNASFAIVGDELQSAAVFDFESQASFSIRVQTSDGNGNVLEQAVAVAVTDVVETTTLTGTVSGLRLDVDVVRAPGVHLLDLGAETLNRLILASQPDGSASASEPPVRGLNAAWLDLLAQQQAYGLLVGQSVVAVSDGGEVLGQGTIAADGSFSLTVLQDRPFALFQAREDGSLLCNKVMGYMDLDSSTGKTVHWRAGFFDIDSSGAAGTPPTELDVGDFAFSEHNASLGGGWSQDPAPAVLAPPAGNYGSCGNPDQVLAPVAADFDLESPFGFDAAELYDFGLALALSYDSAGVPTFLGTGTVGPSGISMRISKVAGVAREMTLVLTDVGVFTPSKIKERPLMPTAMFGSTPPDVQTTLGDSGHDFGTVEGGVARITGVVYDSSSGLPIPNAEILGVLESTETLATNFAVTDADGKYVLLLPVDLVESYTIVATDPVTAWSNSFSGVFLYDPVDVVPPIDFYIFDPNSG